MIEKKDILKMAKHVFRQSNGMPDRRLLSPYREWVIGLVIFVLIIICGSIMSARIFVTYRDLLAVPNADATAQKQLPKYDQVLIDKVLTQYQKREDAYNLLQARGAATDMDNFNATDIASTSSNSGGVNVDTSSTSTNPTQETTSTNPAVTPKNTDTGTPDNGDQSSSGPVLVQ